MSLLTNEHSVNANCLAISDLDDRQHQQMLAVLLRHFPSASAKVFHSDLASKDRAILLSHNNTTVGFSTLAFSTHNGARICFSGDTIVNREHWGSPALATCWLKTINCWRCEQPESEHYWFLICSGFRTYRFLPVFWQQFHPAIPERDDPKLAALLHSIASERFGPAYDPVTGIITLGHKQILRDDLRHPPAGRTRDPHVAQFLARNPGHHRGDELACLVRLHPTNQSRIGRRTCPLNP